jgi:hypothetical protein
MGLLNVASTFVDSKRQAITASLAMDPKDSLLYEVVCKIEGRYFPDTSARCKE